MNLQDLEKREFTASEKKLFTGIAPIQIKLVNPTQKQLADYLGIDEDKVRDPNYIKDSDDPSTRIDFWYENHPDFNTQFRGKFSLFIKKGTNTSKTSGKKQYIDAYTKTAWASSLSELSANQENVKDYLRLDLSTVRECNSGEEAIYTLLKAYGNLNPKTKPLELSSWSDLVKGKGKELQEFFDYFNNSNGGVNVLMGIKDFKYQDIYTKMYLPLYGKPSDYFKKNVESEYGFKSYFNSYTFSTYESDAAPSADEVEDKDYMPSSDSPFISDDSPMNDSFADAKPEALF